MEKNRKRLGVVAAMDKEYLLLKELLDNPKEESIAGFRLCTGTSGGKEICLMKSGIGKVAAATGINLMKYRYAPEAVINSGVAGGMREDLQVGEIVAGTHCVYHDVDCGTGNEYGQVQGFPARYAADACLLAAVKRQQVKDGLICTGDQFIQDPGQLESIRRHFPEVTAVDMESAAMAQVCHIWQISFLSLRIISDTPGRKADNMAQYNDFWELAPQRNFAVLKDLLAAI